MGGTCAGQASRVRVHVCAVWLRVPDSGPMGLTCFPPSLNFSAPPPPLLYFKGGPWPWLVGWAWFPQGQSRVCLGRWQFFLTIPLVLA